MKLGSIYNKQGKYAEAIQTLNIALDLGCKDIYKERGKAHFGQGKYEKATADFTQALEEGDKDIDIYKERGKAYFLQKKIFRSYFRF